MSKPAECLVEIMIYPYLWVSGLVLQGPQQFGGEVPRSLGGEAIRSLGGELPCQAYNEKARRRNNGLYSNGTASIALHVDSAAISNETECRI